MSSIRPSSPVVPSTPTPDHDKALCESTQVDIVKTNKDIEKQDIDNQRGSVRSLPGYEVDPKAKKYADPFGDEEGAEVKYRTMAWWQGAMLMIAETISLGILSLPDAMATIGLVPGIICLIGLGILSTYTGIVYGQFKTRYPHVHNMADAGEILAGGIGREVFGAAQTIFLIFSMGSHILTFNIALNTITDHAICTIAWGGIATVAFWICTLPRTMKNVSWMSIVSFISIISAVMVTMIGVGVHPPDPHVDAITKTSFASAFLAVTNIVFAYTSHVAFFSFISELKEPRDFPKALYLLQGCDISMYIIVAIVVYRYAGPEVVSPALGSTGTVLRKVAYGVALPTIAVAGIIYGHVAAKYIYVRIFRGTEHMSKRTFLSYGSWAGITLTLWIIAWIIAESIPVFNDLLSLISTIFASWFTYGIGGLFWLHMWWGSYRRNIFLTVLNIGLVLITLVIMGAGLYASGKAIHEDSQTASWTCADTSL